MQALVLVGGFGTRLRPLTNTIPKAVVPVANVPYIIRCLDYLERNGVTHAILSMGYLPEPIEKALASTSLKIKVDFRVEECPLDTAGAIRYASAQLEERFFVLNGDILTDIPLAALLDFHLSRRAVATIATVAVDDPRRFGVIETDGSGRVRRFLEKPENPPSRLINAGIYVYERSVLELIPPGVAWSVERDLYPRMLQQGLALYAQAFAGHYWLDIGSPERYLQANFDAISGAHPVFVPAEQVRPGVWVDRTAQVSALADLNPPLLIGAGCHIEDGACLGPFAVLGSGVTVKADATVAEAVVLDDTVIGRRAQVRKCVLSYACQVTAGARVPEGSVVGRGERIQ